MASLTIGFDGHRLDAPDGVGVCSRALLAAVAPLLGERRLVVYGLEAEARPGRELPAGVDGRPGLPRAGEVDLFHGPAGRFPHPWDGPGVFTVHDLTVLSHPGCHTVANRVLTLRGLLHALLGGATLVADSKATAGELARRLGLDLDTIEVVPNAAGDAFRPLGDGVAASRVRASFGLEPGYLLAVGTLEPRKNLARLVAAWSALPESARPPLVLAGGPGWGGDVPGLDAPGVRRLGVVSEADLVALYGAAAVFAYPSLAEGFGLPVVEAMACGTPVVAADRTSLPEVAGDAALLVDPEDPGAIAAALARLLADAGLRRELAERGRRRAAAFSWEASARRLVELWDDVARR